jgi:hypothetical protein
MWSPNALSMASPVVAEPDAFWLKAETPAMPSRWAMGMALADSDEPLSIEGLRSHVRARLPGIPWLSWRIAGRGRRPGRYRWVDTAPFPMDELVVHERLGAGEDIDARVSSLVMERLDLRLSLWRLRLVDLAGGGQGLVLDGHHAFAGGFTVIEILEALLGVQPRPAPDQPTRLATSVPPMAELTDAAWAVAAAARRVAIRLAPARPWEPARVGAPLVGPIAAGRRVISRRLPLDRVEAVGEAFGAGVTRTVTALVSRALDPFVGGEVDAVRALFPHGTQEGPVTRPGNASRSTFLELPVHSEPAVRMARLKECFARNATSGPQAPAVVDLVLSFQPPTPSLSVAGRAVTGITTSAPLRVCSQPLTRLTIVVQRYEDSIFVSLTADEASLGEVVERIGDGLIAALEEYAGEEHRKRAAPAPFPRA